MRFKLVRMQFYTLRTHWSETFRLDAKVSNWRIEMFITRNVVFKICFHVFKSECPCHLNYLLTISAEILYKFIYVRRTH